MHLKLYKYGCGKYFVFLKKASVNGIQLHFD